MLDCAVPRYRTWAVGLAALGLLAIVIGLDQLRRAARGAVPERPLRRFT